MKPDQRLLTIHVSHEHSLGPWAIVQDLGDEYVRVAGITEKGEIGYQAFLAWMPKLKPFLYKPSKDEPMQEKPFTDVQMGKLETLREELSSGKKRVVSTHIVPA